MSESESEIEANYHGKGFRSSGGMFAALNGPSDDTSEASEQSEHENAAQSSPQPSSNTTTSNKKKKSKKKKSKAGKSAKLDEIDQALLELGPASSPSAAPDESSSAPDQPKPTSRLMQLLLCTAPNLNPQIELKRFFGSSSSFLRQSAPSKSFGIASANSRRQKHVLSHPNDQWARYQPCGLQFSADPEHILGQGFQHTPQFRSTLSQFLSAVQSLDPQLILSLNIAAPYFPYVTYQLSEIFSSPESSDPEKSVMFLAQTIYAFESVLPVNLLASPPVLPFSRIENRLFHLSLFKYAHVLAMKGCYRTALEILKFLLSVDISHDAYAVASISIPFLAIKSMQADWLLQFFKSSTNTNPASGYVSALAYLTLGRLEEANIEMQSAIKGFPEISVAICDKLSIPVPKFLLKSFRLPEQSESTELFAQLFVHTTEALWKDEANKNLFLMQFNSATCDSNDLSFADGQMLGLSQESLLNISRHAVVLDLRALWALLPSQITSSTYLPYDPLPPGEGSNHFDDQYFANTYQLNSERSTSFAPANARTTSSFSDLLRGLLGADVELPPDLNDLSQEDQQQMINDILNNEETGDRELQDEPAEEAANSPGILARLQNILF